MRARRTTFNDHSRRCYRTEYAVNPRLVAYYRVSTARQGESGLGIDAQRETVRRFAQATAAEVIAEHVEVETGKRDDLTNRPELRLAIARVQRARAQLIIAKLDRLARSVHVVSLLHTSGIDFVCCDNPSANRLTIQILAAVAEAEARAISERTKAALAAAKRRGVLLGAARPSSRNLTAQSRSHGCAKAALVNAERAREAYRYLVPELREMRASGLSLRQIARELNGRGERTRRNATWNAAQVSRAMALASDEPAPR